MPPGGWPARTECWPPSNDIIPLASNEIHHLLNVFITQPVRDAGIACAGQPGGDSPGTAPGPAAT